MKDEKTKNRFVELRAEGNSFDKISKKLNVSKPTLIKWSRLLSIEISNSKQIELESIREKNFLLKKHRIQKFGELIGKLEKKIDDNFDDISTDKAVALYLKTLDQVEKESQPVQFKEMITTDPVLEMFNNENTSIETWES